MTAVKGPSLDTGFTKVCATWFSQIIPRNDLKSFFNLSRKTR